MKMPLMRSWCHCMPYSSLRIAGACVLIVPQVCGQRRTLQRPARFAIRMSGDGKTHHPKVTHVLFDMDGLLLDTERFYTLAQAEICARYGKQFTWDLKSKMMGQKALTSAETFVEDLQLQGKLTPEEFLQQRDTALHALFPKAEFMPGAETLVRHLKANSIPCAVATSSHRAGFEMKTQRHKDTFALFDHIVTGDQITNGKPAPDIFLKAASLFEPPPEPSSCLVFEDAPAGVQAGVAAGMHTVMVPDPNLDRSKTKAASQVISSLEEFDPALWGLPAYP